MLLRFTRFSILCLLALVFLGSYQEIKAEGTVTELGSIRDTSVGGSGSKLSFPDNFFLVGNKAYVIDGAGSFSIFDITNPADIKELGSVSDDSIGGIATGLVDITDIHVIGDFAYVSSFGDFSIFNVSDPANITEVAHIGPNDIEQSFTGIQELFVEGTKAYLTSRTIDCIYVFDVANPAQPSLVGFIQDQSHNGGQATLLNGVWEIIVKDGIAYTGANDGISFIDLNNPASIVELGTFKTTETSARDLNLVGDKLYFSDFDQVIALDVSDPSNPKELNRFDLDLFDIINTFRIKFFENIIHVLTINEYSVIDVIDFARPRLLAQFQDDSVTGGTLNHILFPTDFQITDGKAFISSGDDKAFSIFDISSIKPFSSGTLSSDLETSYTLKSTAKKQKIRFTITKSSSITENMLCKVSYSGISKKAKKFRFSRKKDSKKIVLSLGKKLLKQFSADDQVEVEVTTDCNKGEHTLRENVTLFFI